MKTPRVVGTAMLILWTLMVLMPHRAFAELNPFTTDQDSLNTERLRKALAEDEKLAYLQLIPKIEGDDVILYGHVNSQDEIKRATELVRRVLGYADVASTIVMVRHDQPVSYGPAPPSLSPDQYHTVEPGESLRHIAGLYDLSVAKLKYINHMQTNRLRIGRRLLVRPGVDPPERFTRIQFRSKPESRPLTAN